MTKEKYCLAVTYVSQLLKQASHFRAKEADSVVSSYSIDEGEKYAIEADKAIDAFSFIFKGSPYFSYERFVSDCNASEKDINELSSKKRIRYW
jgi:hypothetical protein